MYCPSSRLHRFYTNTSGASGDTTTTAGNDFPSAIPRPPEIPRATKKHARAKDVMLHAVKTSQMCDELELPRGTDVRVLCETLRTRRQMIAVGTASGETQARTWSASWVPGTYLIYALTDSNVQYLAVGRVTTTCEIVDSTTVRGTWDVLRTFGTDLTRQAVEHHYSAKPGYNMYDSVVSWDASAKPLTTLLKPNFFRPYVIKFWKIHGDLRADRAAALRSEPLRARAVAWASYLMRDIDESFSLHC